MNDPALMDTARRAAGRAYSPYSGIQVGCAIESERGAIYMACNVENASYGLTVCAERAAIFSAVAIEGPSFRLKRLAVIALGREFPPCGACRQVIAEFAQADTRVLLIRDGALFATTVGELLPMSFKL